MSQFGELQQSREMPRHIQAQMYDLKALTTASKIQEVKAKEAELAKKEKLAPADKKKPQEKPAKPDEPPEKKPEQIIPETSERELEKQKKAEQRKKQQQALTKLLADKKASALKQREVESKRKLAAKKKAEQDQTKKDNQRKQAAEKKKRAKIAANKKALADKKRKNAAIAKKKQQDKKRKAAEKVRIQALQNQIAEEEQFAAEQIAKEMASGVDVYIKRILDSNLNIPLTARSGIKAMVRIKLLASGSIVGVELIESSGNSAFDRAAEQAVWKSESFPKVAEVAKASPSYFNRELRTLIITFKPEGLRW
jgi:colicin import membrane protein